MLSKGETFKPPTPEEEWTDRQFSIILNYLSQYQVPFSGEIYLQWLAVPYISVWKATSTSDEGSTVWIMHNNLQTDHFISASSVSIRDVIMAFGERWMQAGTNILTTHDIKIDNPDEVGDPKRYAAKLIKHGEMFINVSRDVELNFVP